MIAQNPPIVGDKPFLMHREIVITEVFAVFRLIKVHYAEETTEFCVDASALTAEPDYTNSISLRLFRGNCGE